MKNNSLINTARRSESAVECSQPDSRDHNFPSPSSYVQNNNNDQYQISKINQIRDTELSSANNNSIYSHYGKRLEKSQSNFILDHHNASNHNTNLDETNIKSTNCNLLHKINPNNLTGDQNINKPQNSRSRRSARRTDETKTKRTKSVPRFGLEMNHLYEHHLDKCKSNRSYFTQIKPFQSSLKQTPCISIHCLPSFTSFSSHDDTLDDPFDQLLVKSKSQNLAKVSSSNLSSNPSLLNYRGLEKPEDEKSCDAYEVTLSRDSLTFEGFFKSYEPEISDLQKMIIEVNMKAHLPDDLDKEIPHLINHNIVSNSISNAYLALLIIESNIKSVKIF